MKNISVSTAFIIFILFNIPVSKAQDDDKALLQQVEQDDQKAVNAIAMYPPGIRQDIYIASENPEVLVRLNAVQQKTKNRFSDLVSSFSKEEQERIYNLTRYPELIHDLAIAHPGSEGELQTILVKFPEEIHKDARAEAFSNYDVLVQVDKQNQAAKRNFENILKGYPSDAANAYRDLILYPEVINTLYDNMQLTVVIGDVYKRDPAYVTRKTDSLNQVLTAENAQATADWKQSMQENPQAQEEYVQASQEYAQENGYTQDEYTTPMNTDINTYPSYSYNWWFGYPSWYPYAYWDPNPFWFDDGFYYGPHHEIIWFGMPSPYFMSWYFYYPEHCSRYPELSNHYYSYYYGHRGENHWNPVSREVGEWRNRNRDIVNDEWDKDPKGRAQRFKDYGKMESERNAYNKANPRAQMDHEAFVKQNQGKYPSLKVTPVKESNNRSEPSHSFTPEKKPHVSIPDSYRSDRNTKTGGSGATPTPTPTKETRPTNTTEPTNTNNRGGSSGHTTELHNAQQYHQQTWENTRPAPVQHSAPAPHFQSAPMRSSPAPSGGGRRR